MSVPSYLAMTDEDFLKQQAPDGGPAVEAVAIEATTQDTATEVVKVEDQATTDTSNTETTSVEGSQADLDVDTGSASAKTTEVTDTTTTETGSAVKVEPTKESEQTTKDQAKETAAAPDYEAFYKQIMAPFKANGKQIELKTPEEALQLMQMGANYTKKMQDLVPHRKVLLMLENNGLLDEGKLSYLIDLDKKNPEAIKKLIKDSGVDPQEIDTTVEPAYREGNHRVTDEEAAFRTTLDDMKSNPTGLAMLQAIHADWDQASKELLWKEPQVMKIIHDQRESGVYNLIVTEMNRQKTLGQIAPGEPFLQSYKTVGDQMTKANTLNNLTAPRPVVTAQPIVVATTTATIKPTVTNNDQASAASPTRTTSKSAKAFINPLAMSDDDFLKQMKNRV